MNPRLIDCACIVAQPWRNGGGMTRELLAAPDSQNWQYRISVADINGDGTFSSYPGVDRWFAVLEGEGVYLQIDGNGHRQLPHEEPLRFDGAAQIHCRLLGGATRDLNLMLRNVSGRMQRADAGIAWSATDGACGLFARQSGHCHIVDQGDARKTVVVQMPAFSLLWFERAPGSLIFEADRADETRIGYWLAVQTEPTASC
jgi:environmental stress-induced protein Ves